MAEALSPLSQRYFCHICSREINEVLPDFACPTCKTGFIELIDEIQATDNNDDNEGRGAGSLNQNRSSLCPTSGGAGGGGGASSQLHHHPGGAGGGAGGAGGSGISRAARRSLMRQGQGQSSGSSSSNSSDYEPGEHQPPPPRRQRYQSQTQPQSQLEAQAASILLGSMDSDFAGQQQQPRLEQIFLQLFGRLADYGDFGDGEWPGTGPGSQNTNSNTFDNIVSPLVLFSNPGDYLWGRDGLDTFVTQILNQMDGTGPPPLAKDKIESIPTICITQDHLDHHLQCPVCWDAFKLAEPVRRLLCDHIYHPNCIVPWLELHGTCPVCRKELVFEEPHNHPSEDDNNIEKSGDENRSNINQNHNHTSHNVSTSSVFAGGSGSDPASRGTTTARTSLGQINNNNNNRSNVCTGSTSSASASAGPSSSSSSSRRAGNAALNNNSNSNSFFASFSSLLGGLTGSRGASSATSSPAVSAPSPSASTLATSSLQQQQRGTATAATSNSNQARKEQHSYDIDLD